MPVTGGEEMAEGIRAVKPDAKVLLMTRYTDAVIGASPRLVQPKLHEIGQQQNLKPLQRFGSNLPNHQLS